jgi:hypothetical protein
MPTCDQCGKAFYAGDGLWDDDDYMCGECLAGHVAGVEKGSAVQSAKDVKRTLTKNGTTSQQHGNDGDADLPPET